ncbi:vomeronasal type-2 receptor 26-like [Python bivittatus]|uniref:Vomeronasal type-2 receptor 26-like n=1 Tax=Python bivittatus TaxID=176946 RepID=A0A9F5N622_PYTBI|nr:vomeronasal type-2 receptor 26-like [Python bivittatus]
MLSIYKIPQISYGVISHIPEQKHLFPFFYRMIPKQEPPHLAIVKLLLHFRWTWIGLFVPDNENGENFRNSFALEAIKEGVCVAFSEDIQLFDKETKMGKSLHFIHSEVKVIVCYLDFQAALLLALTIPELEYDPKGFGEKVWIATALTDIGVKSFYKYVDLYHKHLLLSLSTQARQRTPYGHFHLDSFSIDQFVKTAFQYSHSSPVLAKKVWVRLTEKENWEFPPRDIVERILFEDAASISTAIQAVSMALNAAYSSQLNRGRMQVRDRLVPQMLPPGQLHRFLRKYQLYNLSGDDVYLDENGIPVADFDIIHWAVFPNWSTGGVKIGKIESVASSEVKLSINESAIIWPTSFQQVAASAAYAAHCEKCPDDQHPNKKRDQCVPKAISYLSYQESLGVILALSASFLSLTTGFVLRIFIKYQETAIVKANNRDLTYVLLISLLLSFLASFLFIGHPQKVTCLLRQTAFSVVFSVAVSSLLAKTIMVVVAFLATKPGSRMRKWLRKNLANSIVLSCSGVQVGICMIWLGISPPFPDSDMHSQPGHIVMQCNEGSVTMFYIALGYLGFLAAICFLVAFISRKLPGSFNEAKWITFSMLVFCSVGICLIWLGISPPFPDYNLHSHPGHIVLQYNEGSVTMFYIALGYMSFLAAICFLVAFLAHKLPGKFNEAKLITFSMLVFCSIWVSFVPSYLSTKEKSMVAVQIFSILASILGLLGCIFAPKCYIIIRRPDMNTKEHLMMKKKGRLLILTIIFLSKVLLRSNKIAWN